MSKVIPRETALSTPYWQGCREGVLKMQHCGDCNQFQFYPRELCSHCDSASLDWRAVSGRARIVSFSIVRRGISAAYEAPYVVALVALEEGPTMMTGIQAATPEDVSVGALVEVVFEFLGEQIELPMFRLSEDRS